MMQRLRCHRAFMNWTQADLAKNTGLTYSQVCRLETRDIELTPEMIKCLTSGLGIPEVTLFCQMKNGALR